MSHTDQIGYTEFAHEWDMWLDSEKVNPIWRDAWYKAHPGCDDVDRDERDEALTAMLPQIHQAAVGYMYRDADGWEITDVGAEALAAMILRNLP